MAGVLVTLIQRVHGRGGRTWFATGLVLAEARRMVSSGMPKLLTPMLLRGRILSTIVQRNQDRKSNVLHQSIFFELLECPPVPLDILE